MFFPYNFISFSSFVWLAGVGVFDADGVGVVEEVPGPFRFLLPGPLLLILSEPGLLGGESLTVGPIVPLEPVPTLLKWPVPSVGPCIIEDDGATAVDGGGVWWLFLLLRFAVVTTVILDKGDTEEDSGGRAITGDVAVIVWLFVEPRFGLRNFSCFSDDWDLKQMIFYFLQCEQWANIRHAFVTIYISL